MRLKDALTRAIRRLTDARVGSPRMNAEVLLMFTLDADRAYLYAHPERELSADEQVRYEEVVARRARGVPAQYITGHQEFWGMDLIVSPAVLIPRPETEHVMEILLPLASARPRATIVDVGTGSGALALAMAKDLPNAQIEATEICCEALEIARANAARHRLEDRIRFYHTDLLRGLPSQAYDFVVSNPPYVGQSEEDQVQLEVRQFEPRGAVFAGPTGLEVIERLLPQARDKLRDGGWLIFEISETIAQACRQLLADWQAVEISKDLQGIARVARAMRPISEKA